MIDFASSFTQFILATFIPLYLGMFFVMLLKDTLHVDVRYLSAFAFGLLFWFFLDTLNDAILLDANEGFNFDFQHTALLSLFVLGFLSLALLTRLGRPMKKGVNQWSSSEILVVSVLVALGMGFHGFGEGLEFGATSAGTPALNVLDAIGGLGGGMAYVLHKFLEATIVMIVCVSLMAHGDSDFRRRFWNVLILGLVFGLPSTLGEFVGYYSPISASYSYALGGGAALFVALLAIRPIFGARNDGEVTYSEWIKIGVTVLLGFLALYSAASLH
jgi:hypothetical protein